MSRRASWRRSRNDLNEKRTKDETAVTILKDFCQDASWEGLSRVVGSNYLFFRVIWLLAFLGALSISIYQLYGLFAFWKTKPINTQISLQHSSSLDFPAVTICNFNILRKSLLPDLPISTRRHIELYAKKKNTTKKAVKKAVQQQSDDDGFPDPSQAGENYQITETVATALMKEDPSVIEGVGHQFETMIHGCKFRGVECTEMNKSSPSTSDWNSFWHYKFGNCFVFNPHAIRGISRKRLKLSKPGPSLGLELEINVQQSEYIDQLTQDAGAVIHISPRGNMPFPYEEGINLAPGYSTSLGLRLVQISRIDRFKNNSCISPTANDNVNIYADSFNSSYSTIACIQSCIAKSQKSYCGCMEYKYYPKDKIICDTFNVTTVNCLRQVNRLAKNNQLSCSNSCPPPCKQDVYRSASSFSSWPSSNYVDQLAGEVNVSETFIRKNFLKVQIYFQDLNYEQITEEISYQLENFLSDIGGQLGLWLGVSVLSGLEVIELIIVLCLYFCCKSEKRLINTSNEVQTTEKAPTNMGFAMT